MNDIATQWIRTILAAEIARIKLPSRIVDEAGARILRSMESKVHREAVLAVLLAATLQEITRP